MKQKGVWLFCKMALVMTLFIHHIPCNSAVYTVKADGDTFEKQIKNILSEIRKLPEGEEALVIIRDGYYCVSNPIEIKGLRHRVIFEGSKKKTTVLSGSIEVKGWEQMSNGLWRCQVPKVDIDNYCPDQLYVNGVRANRSRIPNNGMFVLTEGLTLESKYGAVLTKADIEKIGKNSDNDRPIISLYREWAVSKRYIDVKSIIGDTIFFKGQKFYPNHGIAKGNGIAVENILWGIDEPGEWCVGKDGFIYYKPRNDERINRTQFRVPITERLLIINGNKGKDESVCLRNIVFEHTTHFMPENGDEYEQAASGMSATIEVDNEVGFIFEGCEIRNTANYGLWLRYNCRDSKIKDSYFHDLGAGAIKVSSSSRTPEHWADQILIENNIIHHYGQLMESAVGIILFNASDCKICHNDIHYGNYSGISLGWTWGYALSPTKRNEVAYNRISHIGDGRLNDLGGIYTLGKSEGTRIHHNIISYVVSGDYRGWGIYADEGTSGILVENNLVYRSTSGGYHQNYGSDNVVMNNIFAWGQESQFTITEAKEEKPLTFSNNIIIMDSGFLMSGAGLKSKSVIIDKNCYWNVLGTPFLIEDVGLNDWLQHRDTNSLIIDPSFKDPKNGDFRFKGNVLRKKIGFRRFDFTKSGVYGKKMVKLAKSIR